MKKKVKRIFFEPGQKAEHEGVMYIAESQTRGWFCAGCVFSKRGEPCMCPRGWVCVDVTYNNDVIFKKV